MNTIENNKLIAEFMGFSKVTREHKLEFSYNIKGFAQLGLSETVPSGLKFHSDWNWLMEVVEKIESSVSQFNIKIYTLANTYTDVSIIVSSRKRIDIELQTSKIEAVYNAVIEFIKFYNSPQEIKK